MWRYTTSRCRSGIKHPPSGQMRASTPPSGRMMHTRSPRSVRPLNGQTEPHSHQWAVATESHTPTHRVGISHSRPQLLLLLRCHAVSPHRHLVPTRPTAVEQPPSGTQSKRTTRTARQRSKPPSGKQGPPRGQQDTYLARAPARRRPHPHGSLGAKWQRGSAGG